MPLLLTLVLVVSFLGLLAFAWRSASRRRGFRLVEALERQETVLRFAVDVPVRRGPRPEAERGGIVPRRGTVVLTDRRLAGFSHRARFVFVGGAEGAPRVEARGEWLVIRPRPEGGGAPPPVVSYRVGPEAAAWVREARRRIHGRRA